MATITIPVSQTSAAGFFNTRSTGDMQGYVDDASYLNGKLRQGNCADISIYGGLPVTLKINAANNDQGLLVNQFDNATYTRVDGVSVFNGMTHAITASQATVQTAFTGQSVNYYEVGSTAPIPMAISSTLYAKFAANTIPIIGPFYWDPVNKVVTDVAAGGGQLSTFKFMRLSDLANTLVIDKTGKLINTSLGGVFCAVFAI
jgi:hypothetical protein